MHYLYGRSFIAFLPFLHQVALFYPKFFYFFLADNARFLLCGTFCLSLCFLFFFDMLGNKDKSLVLPHKVSESLQSTLDSPKEAVDKLLHNLDDASLEHPKPETEKWIRCLARNVKDQSRTDVFSYLREIVPAGTTGKQAEMVSSFKKRFYMELEHARKPVQVVHSPSYVEIR